MSVREQFLADARRHKGNDMTQALRDALDVLTTPRTMSEFATAGDLAAALLVDRQYAADKLRALLARLTSDGDMVLVPRVPTKAMHAAFYDASSRDQRVFPGPSVVWKAMCDAAAPAQPSEGEPR